MEVIDPEGLTDQAFAQIGTFTNTAPTASFIVTTKQSMSKTYYQFDASATSDAETKANKLLYRWDFNYSGKDDIVFDSSWTTSPKQSGTFSLPGIKKIRLQVKDADGAVSEAFGEVAVGA